MLFMAPVTLLAEDTSSEEINTKKSKIVLTVHKYLLSQHNVGVTSCHLT